MKPLAQRGFTLLELLIVMAVIGAVLATASLAMGPDPHRQGRQALAELGARLSALREQAVLLDSQYAIALSEAGWQAMALREGTWTELPPAGALGTGMAWQLTVEGQAVLLPATLPATPQLLVLASDELSSFELRLQWQGQSVGVLRTDGAGDPELRP